MVPSSAASDIGHVAQTVPHNKPTSKSLQLPDQLVCFRWFVILEQGYAVAAQAMTKKPRCQASTAIRKTHHPTVDPSGALALFHI